MFTTSNVRHLSLRIMRKIREVLFLLRKFTVLMMCRNLTKRCFHFPPRRTGEGIESSNSRWYMLHPNNTTERLLLLRQQAGIKAVSLGDSLGRFNSSCLWCFSLSSSSSPETPPHFNSPANTHAATTLTHKKKGKKNHIHGIAQDTITHVYVSVCTSGQSL